MVREESKRGGPYLRRPVDVGVDEIEVERLLQDAGRRAAGALIAAGRRQFDVRTGRRIVGALAIRPIAPTATMPWIESRDCAQAIQCGLPSSKSLPAAIGDEGAVRRRIDEAHPATVVRDASSRPMLMLITLAPLSTA